MLLFCASLPLLSWRNLYFPKTCSILSYILCLNILFSSFGTRHNIQLSSTPIFWNSAFLLIPSSNYNLFFHTGNCLFHLYLLKQNVSFIRYLWKDLEFNFDLISQNQTFSLCFCLVPPHPPPPCPAIYWDHLVQLFKQSFNPLYIILERKLFLWWSIHCLMTYSVAGFCNC